METARKGAENSKNYRLNLLMVQSFHNCLRDQLSAGAHGAGLRLRIILTEGDKINMFGIHQLTNVF